MGCWWPPAASPLWWTDLNQQKTGLLLEVMSCLQTQGQPVGMNEWYGDSQPKPAVLWFTLYDSIAGHKLVWFFLHAVPFPITLKGFSWRTLPSENLANSHFYIRLCFLREPWQIPTPCSYCQHLPSPALMFMSFLLPLLWTARYSCIWFVCLSSGSDLVPSGGISLRPTQTQRQGNLQRPRGEVRGRGIRGILHFQEQEKRGHETSVCG